MTHFTFHPFVAELLSLAEENPAPPLSTLTAPEARAARNPVIKELLGPPEEVAAVEDLIVPSKSGPIPVRIYRPAPEGTYPILVYYHGGGWVVGNLETHDSLCRALANGIGCIVVAVDYRLAPEHKFPAAVEDSYTALLWASSNAERIGGDAARIAVGGDSAGGNLAAVVCLLARDKKGPKIKHQLIVYPVMDLSSFETESYRRYGKSFILTAEGMTYYRDMYLNGPQDAHHLWASPLLADLSGLPPALVITAEYDILTSEGEAYAGKLERSGVPVKYSCYPGVIHLFFGMAGIDRSRNGLKEAFAVFKGALA